MTTLGIGIFEVATLDVGTFEAVTLETGWAGEKPAEGTA